MVPGVRMSRNVRLSLSEADDGSMWRFEHKQEKAKGATGCEGDVGSSSIYQLSFIFINIYVQNFNYSL